MNITDLAALELKHQIEMIELKEVNAKLMMNAENKVFVKNLTPKEEEELCAKNEIEMAIRDVIEEFELKVAIQREEKKSKRVCNPKENRLISAKPMQLATISPDGLTATNNKDDRGTVYAEKGFIISGANLRKQMNNFTGTILYYFEVTRASENMAWYSIGYSYGDIPDGTRGYLVGTYGLPGAHRACWLSNKIVVSFVDSEPHDDGGIGIGFTQGCGLLVDPEDNLEIFFTRNGHLMGTQYVITPSYDCIFPTITLSPGACVEANFGNDLDNKPFRYDIDKCEGLIFR